jgi:glycosyltransferase involved in cell wall biosynthesis
MTDRPAVSVCIRGYRDGPHLHRAVASVLRQTFEDFEIVISDDSGTQRSIAAGFNDRRIRYSENPEPAGPAANLRRVIGLSHADLIAILNDDDEWLPTFLATAVRRFDDDPTLGVVFADCLWEVGGRRVPYSMPFAPGRQHEFLTQILERGLPCASTLIRRTVWEDGEQVLPLQPNMVGDMLLWLRAAAGGCAFSYIDADLAVMHVDREQVSWGSDYARRAIATLEALEFDGTAERMRRLRLGELHVGVARAELRRLHVAAAREALAEASATGFRLWSARGLLALSGVRALTIRTVTSHPWMLAVALPVWRCVRPAVMPSRAQSAT